MQVYAFTSRGRHEWYSTQVADVDLMTERLLLTLGIDFSRTRLPWPFENDDSLFNDYFHKGIITPPMLLKKEKYLTVSRSLTSIHPKLFLSMIRQIRLQLLKKC